MLIYILKEENKKSQSLKNKFELTDIEYVQQEIQSITSKIEKEKIALRISQERYQKKLKEYNDLEGKPSSKTKEQTTCSYCRKRIKKEKT